MRYDGIFHFVGLLMLAGADPPFCWNLGSLVDLIQHCTYVALLMDGEDCNNDQYHIFDIKTNDGINLD